MTLLLRDNYVLCNVSEDLQNVAFHLPPCSPVGSEEVWGIFVCLGRRYVGAPLMVQWLALGCVV